MHWILSVILISRLFLHRHTSFNMKINIRVGTQPYSVGDCHFKLPSNTLRSHQILSLFITAHTDKIELCTAVLQAQIFAAATYGMLLLLSLLVKI